MSTELTREIARRRTFAIISHPDAGKTTLTEKFLLYGGAVQLAGSVTARKTHVVRVNWQALHLEGVQRDYQLKLRLGHGLDFEELSADLRDGVLTVVVPKLESAALRHRRVA